MTSRTFCLALIFLGLAVTAHAQESVTLTTPKVPPQQTKVEVERIIIDVKADTVMVQMVGNNGEASSAVYGAATTPPTLNPKGATQKTGPVLLKEVITADHRTVSVVRQLMVQLQADGYIPAGTLTGAPK